MQNKYIFLLSVAQEDNQPDEMPIMAVMVAVSSLLVIIFIIIILYMLRSDNNDTLDETGF